MAGIDGRPSSGLPICQGGALHPAAIAQTPRMSAARNVTPRDPAPVPAGDGVTMSASRAPPTSVPAKKDSVGKPIGSRKIADGVMAAASGAKASGNEEIAGLPPTSTSRMAIIAAAAISPARRARVQTSDSARSLGAPPIGWASSLNASATSGGHRYADHRADRLQRRAAHLVGQHAFGRQDRRRRASP